MPETSLVWKSTSGTLRRRARLAVVGRRSNRETSSKQTGRASWTKKEEAGLCWEIRLGLPTRSWACLAARICLPRATFKVTEGLMRSPARRTLISLSGCCWNRLVGSRNGPAGSQCWLRRQWPVRFFDRCGRWASLSEGLRSSRWTRCAILGLLWTPAYSCCLSAWASHQGFAMCSMAWRSPSPAGQLATLMGSWSRTSISSCSTAIFSGIMSSMFGAQGSNTTVRGSWT